MSEGVKVKITKVVIKNYRCLKDSVVPLNDHLNIIVGDNECGKSTLLEAINLALTGQLNGRPIAGEVHPYLFNSVAVTEYIGALIAKTTAPPPSIVVELYLANCPELAELKGTNNTAKEDVPGVRLTIEFNEEYKAEYEIYISAPESIRAVPVEYYIVRLRNFAGNDITPRAIPLKPSFIDASTIRNNAVANRYVLDLVKDGLTTRQKVDLALSYRLMKDRFLAENKVSEINKALGAKKGHISEKPLSISLDTTSRASWEMGIMPHLADIPMPLVGKGEQNSVKIKLAMEAAAECHVFLIEEPENHLSFSRLNSLIKHISDRQDDRQLLITTHSSFVMNKLGVDAVVLFANGIGSTLKSLTPDTHDYFLKLPGYDTLRLILSGRAILVEGPSDELIVQRAFQITHGRLPLEARIDVISVGSLAFKRFLEIANILNTTVDVVTDNDGDVPALEEKYSNYLNHQHIHIRYSKEAAHRSLENQLLAANGLDKVNRILGKGFKTDAAVLKWMTANKTESALRFFETKEPWTTPEYIASAITQ